MSEYDTLVIGAGIGGLLSACRLGQAGQRVLLIENMSFLGGRFSAFKFDGAEISTGAFHTFPHGAKGPIAQSLRRSGIQLPVITPEIFASFHVDGRHLIARSGFGVFQTVPTWSDKLMLWRALLQAWFQVDYEGTYGAWLLHIGASSAVRQVFDRFAQFALSTTIYDIPYHEARYVIAAVIRYGLPGVPAGGARAVARSLERACQQNNVTIKKNTRLKRLLTRENRICGAVLYDRRSDTEYEISANRVISNASPQATIDMANQAELTSLRHHHHDSSSTLAAAGLKFQVLSPHSLIDHDSIMFCLDTQRVAGILQATNADPKLAPQDHHLLISHQVIAPGADWRIERDIALEDWRYLFGTKFDDCEIIGTSHFPQRFPVNWATQGLDLREQPYADNGLWLVGDGVKPPGLMMVEGVAASAEQVTSRILGRSYQTLKIPIMDAFKR